MESLESAVLSAIRSTVGGISDVDLKSEFPDRYKELPDIITGLIKKRHISRFKKDNHMIFMVEQAEISAKLNGLGEDHLKVYDTIASTRERGVLSRDLREMTKIQLQTLTKILKVLEVKELIKHVKSVSKANRKLYMLFSLEPSREVTGGPWYTDQIFDVEFKRTISEYILAVVGRRLRTSGSDIYRQVSSSGIFSVSLSKEDVTMLTKSLVYDGKLDEIKVHDIESSHLSLKRKRRDDDDDDDMNEFEDDDDDDNVCYSTRMPYTSSCSLCEVPCVSCPVRSECRIGSAISPSNCMYMKQWLKLT